MSNTIRFILEGLLTVVVTFGFSLMWGLFIWFLWPVIVTAIPGLEGIVAERIHYVDGVGISFLLNVLVASLRQ
jgi:hypothetical protein